MQKLKEQIKQKLKKLRNIRSDQPESYEDASSIELQGKIDALLWVLKKLETTEITMYTVEEGSTNLIKESLDYKLYKGQGEDLLSYAQGWVDFFNAQLRQPGEKKRILSYVEERISP